MLTKSPANYLCLRSASGEGDGKTGERVTGFLLPGQGRFKGQTTWLSFLQEALSTRCLRGIPWKWFVVCGVKVLCLSANASDGYEIRRCSSAWRWHGASPRKTIAALREYAGIDLSLMLILTHTFPFSVVQISMRRYIEEKLTPIMLSR